MSELKIDVSEQIKTLVQKAADAADSGDAMRFAQAATNTANAMACTLATLREYDQPKE